jgi:hypothetical protein
VEGITPTPLEEIKDGRISSRSRKRSSPEVTTEGFRRMPDLSVVWLSKEYSWRELG